MIKALAVPVGASDAVFLDRLTSSGFSVSEALDIFNFVQDPNRFVDTYGGWHASCLFAAFSSAAWLSFDFVDGILVPGAGSMAGTSLADVLFVVAFAAVVGHFDGLCRDK
eukprot:1382053-Karenia_brevis.AAC.1